MLSPGPRSSGRPYAMYERGPRSGCPADLGRCVTKLSGPSHGLVYSGNGKPAMKCE
jgi:hypothetical protein